MELVAEQRVGYTPGLEFNLPRLHPLVAVAAIAGNGKSLRAVVAGAAGFPLFHGGHGDVLFLAGDHLAVMAALAFAAGLGNMQGVTENRFGRPFGFIYNTARLSRMAADASLFIGHAEGLDPGMTGSARPGLFHFRHCIMFWLFYVEYGIMAYPAVVVILTLMVMMAESLGIGVFEFEENVLGFLGK